MTVLVGKKAPFFESQDVFAAVSGQGEILEDFNFGKVAKGKYAVVFFYPLDFTFVCPSELIAFDHRLPEFKARGVEVFGVSVDSQFSHHTWRKTPINQGGIGAVGYPLVADVQHKICQAYDVESEGGVAFRGSFLVDRQCMVRHQVINDLPLGRNVDEMLRMVDALQFFEEHGEVCPAGWQKGQKGMRASEAGVAEFLTEHADSL